VTEQARVDDQTGYGYLWWLRSLAPAGGGGQLPSYQMQGNGGSKVAVFPAAGLVAVLTSTNYNTPGMHQQTERLLTDYILPALG
jgi:CubicO group peptidase (beta-lactamase class C family)